LIENFDSLTHIEIDEIEKEREFYFIQTNLKLAIIVIMFVHKLKRNKILENTMNGPKLS